MAFLSPRASADARKRFPLPGGGEVALPGAYEPVAEDDYRWQETAPSSPTATTVT